MCYLTEESKRFIQHNFYVYMVSDTRQRNTQRECKRDAAISRATLCDQQQGIFYMHLPQTG